MTQQQQPVTELDCEQLELIGYDQFLQLILPDNKDFTDLVMNRQADRDKLELLN